MNKFGSRLLLFFVSCALFAFTGNVRGAAKDIDWPTRPVRLLVPAMPGGSQDIVARLLAPELSEQLGERFIVDNRSGASGNIGMEIAARAQPDGYTLFVGNVSNTTINPTIFASVLRFDPVNDLKGVTMVASFPVVIFARVAFPPNTFKELVAYSLARPGGFTYVVNRGSTTHLDWLELMSRTGIKMVHLPSKSVSAATTEVISGEADVGFANIATALPHIRTGRLKGFASFASRRLPELPDVPTLAEVGYPGIGSEIWNGIFVPAKTPDAIVDKLYRALVRAVQSKQATFAQAQVPIALSNSPPQFQEFVRAEAKRFARIIKDHDYTNLEKY